MAVDVLPTDETWLGPSYSMYVWTEGFDDSLTGGDSLIFDWDSQNETYSTHTWNTDERRQWLWATCRRTGRRISEIYLSGAHDILRTAYELNSPTHHGLDLIRRTIREGHEQVPGLKIFALYADSDLSVTEQKKVRHAVWYNDVCAG